MMIIVMMLLPRYIRVRYEDLAANTSSVLHRLYTYLGLSYTAQVEKFDNIDNYHNDDEDDNDLYQPGGGRGLQPYARGHEWY